MSQLVTPEVIGQRIIFLRGERVMLDADLASLYGVETKRLNEQVRRNLERFPGDFMFQLTAEEKAEVVANCDHLARLKFSSQLPLAFTEHGAIMAANVLNTPRAIEAGLYVVRAFVRFRAMLAANKELAGKLLELEKKIAGHDTTIRHLVAAIRDLAGGEPAGKKRPIGYARD